MQLRAGHVRKDSSRRVVNDILYCVIRRMIRKWWDDRLKRMEKAAEHGDAKTLHNEVKRLLDFIAKDEGSRRALSSDHEAEQKGMTKHFSHILNINRPVDMTV